MLEHNVRHSTRKKSVPLAEYASSESSPKRGASAGKTPVVDASTQRKRRTQLQRKEEAGRRLLEAALLIVAERGAERLTLADVGAAAGYSRGLPMHYFGSKQGLLRALAEHLRTSFAIDRAAATVKAAPGLATVLQTIDYYFSRPSTKFTSARAGLVMSTESLFKDSALAESMREYNRSALSFVESQIREGVQRKEIHPEADPRASAVIIIGALRGTMLQWLNDPDIDIVAVRNRLVLSIETMLKASGAVAPVPKAVPVSKAVR